MGSLPGAESSSIQSYKYRFSHIKLSEQCNYDGGINSSVNAFPPARLVFEHKHKKGEGMVAEETMH